MMGLLYTFAIAAYFLLSSVQTFAIQSTSAQTPCPTVVGLLVSELVFGMSISDLPRVELRQCGPGTSENIQIVAWEKDGKTPLLVLDTSDFTVVQTAVRKNVYVIETAGGARDRIYVIVYEKTKPVLKLMKVTQGTATITIGKDAIDIVIAGIYAGDAEPRTEKHRFAFR